MCRNGLPDYVVTFRKPGDNPEPVEHEDGLKRFYGEDEPEGYYLVVDAQGIPILVSTTIGGATRMSNGQTLGSTQIKTNVTKIDKKIKSVDGTWKDSAAATNGETRDFKAKIGRASCRERV